MELVGPVDFVAGAEATALDSSLALALAAPIDTKGNAKTATSSIDLSLFTFFSPHDGGN
jgi:hypothetical protein